MRDLATRLAALESRLNSKLGQVGKEQSQQSSMAEDESWMDVDLQRTFRSSAAGKPSPNPPTTSISKGSSGMDADLSDSSHGTSTSHISPPRDPPISSLLAVNNASTVPIQPIRRAPGPQAINPTLYLPFPTPSPTLPFLNYTASTASRSSLHTNTGRAPSPFMAALQNMSFSGGAPNLDAPGEKQANNGKGMGAEEAANVLLAFSSPDSMRPTNVGITPNMTPIVGEGGRPRRLTLDGEEFVLDNGVSSQDPRRAAPNLYGDQTQRVGKAARDIHAWVSWRGS